MSPNAPSSLSQSMMDYDISTEKKFTKPKLIRTKIDQDYNYSDDDDNDNLKSTGLDEFKKAEPQQNLFFNTPIKTNYDDTHDYTMSNYYDSSLFKSPSLLSDNNINKRLEIHKEINIPSSSSLSNFDNQYPENINLLSSTGNDPPTTNIHDLLEIKDPNIDTTENAEQPPAIPIKNNNEEEEHKEEKRKHRKTDKEQIIDEALNKLTVTKRNIINNKVKLMKNHINDKRNTDRLDESNVKIYNELKKISKITSREVADVKVSTAKKLLNDYYSNMLN
jgi:hypothetical protein